MRILRWAAVLLVAWCAVAQDTPKFQAGARLVLVPAVVKDKAGKHVGGLTKEQFRLLQDGKDQSITVFEEVHPVRSHLAPATPPGEFSNMVADASPRTYTVIAVDMINTPPLAIRYMKEDLLKYVGQVALAGDPIALVTLEPGRSRVAFDFTTDPKLLVAAVERLKGKPNSNPSAASATLANPPYSEVQSAAVADPGGAMMVQNQLNGWMTTVMATDSLSRLQQAQLRRDTLEAMRALAAALKACPDAKAWSG